MSARARWLAALALCGSAGCAFAQASAAASGPASAAPSFTLDPAHTFVHWEVLHMGTSTIRGRFDRIKGAVLFDPQAERLDVSISVDTASVSSGTPEFDAVLRELLGAAATPQAFFTARGARFEGRQPREVRGEFTLRGVSQPLSLRALRWNCVPNPLFRREVCGGDFEAQIDRSAFGITHSLPFVADRVRLLIQIEAIAP